MRHFLFLLSLTYCPAMVKAQTVKSYMVIDGQSVQPMDSLIIKSQAEAKERERLRQQFRRVNDSLFAAGRYSDVVTNCGRSNEHALADDINYYLVACYDALGIVPLHDSMLRKALAFNDSSFSTMASISFNAASDTNAALLSYLNRPGRREMVERLIVAQYGKIVKPKDRGKARRLWHLLLNDQFIRGWHMSGQLTDSIFIRLNNTNLDEQYRMFREAGHLFTKAEVGAGLNYEQFLLLAHEADPARRNEYLQLIRAAAASGECPLRRVPDFILRTEMIQKGVRQFFMELETKEEAVRKEYNLPDYYFSIN